MTAPPLNVLIVEDDARLRADLQRTVAALPGLAPIAAVGTVADARRVIESEAGVGLMLVDLGLPDGHGARRIRLLRSTTPAARVLVLSMFDDEAYVLAALAAGADGYLLKEASGDAIARAVRDVLAGDAPLSPRSASRPRSPAGLACRCTPSTPTCATATPSSMPATGRRR